MLWSTWIIAAAAGLALLIDRCCGEPPLRWHPVVWMGRCLHAMQAWVFRPAGAAPPRLFRRGGLAWCGGALVCLAVALALEWLLRACPPWLAVPLLALLLKPMLAWRMLRTEVLDVELALAQSLPAGQQQLARLVSRDTTVLDAAQVRESAIESLSENLGDSVIAPLFWFALLGLPGAVLYRFANTADAMWGYPGERGGRDWQWAGKWAARADDALSWLPARLTAALLLAANRAQGGWRSGLWRRLPAEADRTPSPNSGWPMAAMALLLGCRLGKPQVYVLNADGTVPRPDHTPLAARLAGRAIAGGLALLVSMALAAQLL